MDWENEQVVGVVSAKAQNEVQPELGRGFVTQTEAATTSEQFPKHFVTGISQVFIKIFLEKRTAMRWVQGILPIFFV